MGDYAKAAVLVASLLSGTACYWTGYCRLNVPTAGMEPTIAQGETVFVRWYGRGHAPTIHRGDIVVFYPPFDDSINYIKRVVALAGDRVEITNGELLVNTNPVAEEYGRNVTPTGRALSFPEIVVPEGKVFVLGDNWANSVDSRMYGAIPIESIEGMWPAW